MPEGGRRGCQVEDECQGGNEGSTWGEDEGYGERGSEGARGEMKTPK